MNPIRRRLAIGLLVALTGSIFAVWHGGPAHASLVGSGSGDVARGAPGAPKPAASPNSPGSFTIAGSVDGLYPGLTKPLTLTVSNPQHFAIVVTSLTVAVEDADPGCTAGNVALTPFSGTLEVGALASASVTLQITLLHQAPDSCQGAVFPLEYSGLAVKR